MAKHDTGNEQPPNKRIAAAILVWIKRYNATGLDAVMHAGSFFFNRRRRAKNGPAWRRFGGVEHTVKHRIPDRVSSVKIVNFSKLK